jgi:hypothetical protein
MEVERDSNGGFPEPVAGEPVRLVRARHDACGASTRVRVPQALPARAVRRVVCESCRQPFACDGVDDGGIVAGGSGSGAGAAGAGRSRVPAWLTDPQSGVWKYLSIPVAAAAVILALVLLQGSGDSDQNSSSSAAPSGLEAGAGGAGGAEASGSNNGAELVKGSSFTLALPPGWARTEVQNGATFAASARDGGATANLWVQRDPSLDFPKFEAQSLAQLRQAAGSASVANRTPGPTADSTIVTLAADSPPPGAPAYEVTLRLAGPYRYYLATTVEANASREAADGAELIHSSFVPVATGKSG